MLILRSPVLNVCMCVLTRVELVSQGLRRNQRAEDEACSL